MVAIGYMRRQDLLYYASLKDIMSIPANQSPDTRHKNMAQVTVVSFVTLPKPLIVRFGTA